MTQRYRLHTIRRARMSGPNARSAPEGEAVVAEQHAGELERRVRELRQVAGELRG